MQVDGQTVRGIARTFKNIYGLGSTEKEQKGATLVHRKYTNRRSWRERERERERVTTLGPFMVAIFESGNVVMYNVYSFKVMIWWSATITYLSLLRENKLFMPF